MGFLAGERTPDAFFTIRYCNSAIICQRGPPPMGVFKEGCVASVTCHGAGCWVGASWMAFIIRGSSVLRKPAFNPLSGIAACCEEEKKEEGPVSFSNIGGDG